MCTYVRVYVDANETRVNKSCNRKIDECAFFLIVRLFPRNYLLRLFYLRYWSPISFDYPFNFPYNFPVSINFPFPLTSLTFRFPFLQTFLTTIAIEIFLKLANYPRESPMRFKFVQLHILYVLSSDTRPISSNRSIRFRNTTHAPCRGDRKRAVERFQIVRAKSNTESLCAGHRYARG